MPWGKLLRIPIVRAFVTAHFCHNWALFVLVSWLPSYFHEHLGLGVARAGLYSALPWVTNLAALMVGGSAGDALIGRGRHPLNVRRWFAAAGLAAAALCLLLLRPVNSAEVALLLTCLATFTLGLAAAGFTSVPLDLAPRHAPMLIGFSNTLATIPGILGVAITGWLLDLTHTYAATFLATAALTLIGALALALVSRPQAPEI
jgi:ACS family sodium-dependent inorganic phosphate cotransporter